MDWLETVKHDPRSRSITCGVICTNLGPVWILCNITTCVENVNNTVRKVNPKIIIVKDILINRKWKFVIFLSKDDTVVIVELVKDKGKLYIACNMVSILCDN